MSLCMLSGWHCTTWMSLRWRPTALHKCFSTHSVKSMPTGGGPGGLGAAGGMTECFTRASVSSVIPLEQAAGQVDWALPEGWRLEHPALAGEELVAGVYVRLFLKNPTFPLRTPRGFLQVGPLCSIHLYRISALEESEGVDLRLCAGDSHPSHCTTRGASCRPPVCCNALHASALDWHTFSVNECCTDSQPA